MKSNGVENFEDSTSFNKQSVVNDVINIVIVIWELHSFIKINNLQERVLLISAGSS